MAGNDTYYFNTDTPPKNATNVNKAVVREVEVSGSTPDIIYFASLVKLTGTDTINLQTGDINVKLDHTGTNFDSTRIGDGVETWEINPDGSGKFSGSTVLYGSGGTSVNVVKNHLLVSGLTNIENVNVSSGHLKTSGITSISNVSVSGNSLQTIITDNEGFIGAVGGRSKKPILKITRPSNTTQYSILDLLSSGGTVMQQFDGSLRSSNKNAWAVGGTCSKSVSATTEANIDLHLFSSASTIVNDNVLYEPDVNVLDHHLGYITFSSWKVLGNRAVSTGSIEAPILLKSLNETNTLIYGVPVLRNTYTPTSGEIFSFQLDIGQD